MQIYNLTSKRSGRPVANQFAIICKDGTGYFRSYNSNICKIEPNGTVSLDKYYWKYSRTTTKYLCQFLGMNSEQIKANVDAGIFKMVDMNNANTYNEIYNL